jgi:hypothetical protein
VPLRRGITQPGDQTGQAGGRQRRVFLHDHIDERIEPGAPRGGIERAVVVFVRGIQANATIAPRHPQQAAVVHAIEQVRGRVRRAAPGVDGAAVREVRVDLARVHRAALAHESEQVSRLALLHHAPRPGAGAWVHQRLVLRRHETVVDEEVFFDAEACIAPLQVAGAVAFHAVAQCQVLRARRSADRVGLHEAELVHRALQRGRGEEAAGDGEAAQLVQCDRHVRMMPNSAAITAS